MAAGHGVVSVAVDDFMLRIFQSEVAMQCRFIIAAADDLSSISPEQLTPGLGLTDPYWRPLQTILVSAANLQDVLGEKHSH